MEGSGKNLVQISIRKPSAASADRSHAGMNESLTIDIAALHEKLCENIDGEVRFAESDRGMYASDASNYRMVPLGVILPKNIRDVEAAVAACRESGVPVHARGGGTGIPGQTVNNGVLIDFSKYMNRVLQLDPIKRSARVQPGTVLDTLRDAAEEFHLTFGPDPATHSRCTLGGMVGNNSCGVHSVTAGETSDNVQALEILLYDGTRMTVGETSDDTFYEMIRRGGRQAEIYRKLRDLRDRHANGIRRNFPAIRRRVSGYNLPALLPENNFNVARSLVGSESTCVFVLEASVRLVPSPPVRSLLVIGYPNIFEAADNILVPMPFKPMALEALDDTFIADMKKKGMHPQNLNMMPDGKAWLLVEFGGESREEANSKAEKLIDHLRNDGNRPFKLFDDPAEEKLVWYLREEGLGATAKIPGEPDNHEGWEDSSVPPEDLGKYLRDLQKLFDKYGYYGALYGHFGEGCVHTRLNFDLETSDGIEQFRSFIAKASDLVVSYGGSLSGEHGDGQARGEFLPKMFDEEMIGAFREFKSIWDPEWKMNPGKLIDPYAVDEHLRLGTSYDPPVPETSFAYKDDNYNFAQAAERCVGAGVCRRNGGGVMCPSYMVTLEEKHSTRGRARLLGEMVRGETITDGWQSEAVKEALDLCLACKGCKGECPVQVDMATYKAEFLSHYYSGRLRPRSAHFMGRIHRWARFASFAPSIANFLSQTPGIRTAARWVADVHPKRTIPKFADHTFKSWFGKSRANFKSPQDGPRLILWPDTFNNYFRPHVAKAAVEVLQSAGFQVVVPERNLCCGRPLYDWGMLDDARDLLTEVLDTLKDEIENGTPVVVLEPSCASVFKEELLNFFPRSENAKRLAAQTYLLSNFIRHNADGFELPKIETTALVHGHCHHRSIFRMDDDEAVLKMIGIDYQMPETGCCGMAGAFGFEREHYDIAMRCGERILLPAVRKLGKEALIITDGFSCQEQIRQSTGKQALHLAEVLRKAMHS